MIYWKYSNPINDNFALIIKFELQSECKCLNLFMEANLPYLHSISPL